jgi:hypothetical protein
VAAAKPAAKFADGHCVTGDAAESPPQQSARNLLTQGIDDEIGVIKAPAGLDGQILATGTMHAAIGQIDLNIVLPGHQTAFISTLLSDADRFNVRIQHLALIMGEHMQRR